MGWKRSLVSPDQTTRTYQILQHLSLPLTGWKWILSHIWVSVCVTYERKSLAVAVRVTRRWTGEISKCEREGKEECDRRDTLQLIDSIVKKHEEQRTMEQQLIIRILVKEHKEGNRHRSIWTKNWISERIKAILLPLIISKWHLIIADS